MRLDPEWGFALLLGLSGWVLPYRFNLLRLRRGWASLLPERAARAVPRALGTVLILIGIVGIAIDASESRAAAHDPPIAPDPWTPAWYLESASAFRALGFFAADAHLPDDALAEALAARVDAAYDGPPTGVDRPDLFLVGLDEARTWWEDTEQVAPGEDFYANAVRAWGRLSRGAFAPLDVEEVWETDEGPIRVAFTLGGARHEIHPELLADWMDLGILSEVNALLPGDGPRLALVDTDDQTAFVVALTSEERTALARDRGWVFLDA